MHPPGSAHALPGSLGLDRVATRSRFRHLPPFRATFATNPEAEQGDVLGTVQTALVSAQASEAHLGEFLSNPLEAKGVCDESFVDDGQVFVRPFQFDPFLRALEGALRMAPSKAPRACFVLLSASRSFRVGTRRTCTTPWSRAPPRWGQL